MDTLPDNWTLALCQRSMTADQAITNHFLIGVVPQLISASASCMCKHSCSTACVGCAIAQYGHFESLMLVVSATDLQCQRFNKNIEKITSTSIIIIS